MHKLQSRTGSVQATNCSSTQPLRLIRRGLLLAALLAVVSGAQCLSPIPAVEVIPLSSVNAKPRVRLTTSQGDIVLELFAQQAPVTVENFLQYVREGFYDYTLFHQVLAGQSITTGKYDENLAAKVTRDPIINESNNGLSNLAGRIAMVQPDGADSATSAFIIRINDATSNDFNLSNNTPGLTVFGRVLEGMSVVEAIGNQSVTTAQDADDESLSNVPTENIVILQATIETEALNPDNTAPVADAGADRSVQANQLVTLDGSGSHDPDDEPIAFTWRQISGPTITLNRSDVVRPSFTPETVARLTFELTVTDAAGATGTDTVQVDVSADGNHPPTASAGVDQTVLGGATVTLDGSGSSDVDFQTLTYAWAQVAGSPVELSDATAISPTFNAPMARGLLTFRLTVVDALGGTAAATTSVRIYGLPADAGADENVSAASTVTLRGSVATGDTRTWTQIAGTSVTLSDANAAELTFTAPSTSGPVTFRLSSQTSTGATTQDEVTVFVYVRTDSGLQYCDVVQGTGALIEATDSVKALYTGRLDDQNGEMFDSTSLRDDQPSTFSLASVIAGWTEGLSNYGMRVGGTRLLIIPPDLAYGEAGQGSIPANATLWFEVEVLEVP